MADINLTVGGGAKFASFNLKDNVTGNYISATYSNIQFNNSNPDFAIIEPNPNSTDSGVKADDIAIGSGTVTITVDVTYTDAGDNQVHTETLSVTKTFEVIGSPHGATLELNFS